jgi:hypothetical protein
VNMRIVHPHKNNRRSLFDRYSTATVATHNISVAIPPTYFVHIRDMDIYLHLKLVQLSKQLSEG